MLRYAIHYISYTTIIAPFFIPCNNFYTSKHIYCVEHNGRVEKKSFVWYGSCVVWKPLLHSTKASIIVTFNFHPIKIACQKE